MLNCRFFEEVKTIVSISSFSLNFYQYQITSACFEIWLSLHVLTCLSLKAAVHFRESASIKRKHEKLLNSHFSVGVAPASQCFNTCFTKTVPMLIYKSFWRLMYNLSAAENENSGQVADSRESQPNQQELWKVDCLYDLQRLLFIWPLAEPSKVGLD